MFLPTESQFSRLLRHAFRKPFIEAQSCSSGWSDAKLDVSWAAALTRNARVTCSDPNCKRTRSARSAAWVLGSSLAVLFALVFINLGEIH
jgi:hypothetical protein